MEFWRFDEPRTPSDTRKQQQLRHLVAPSMKCKRGKYPGQQGICLLLTKILSGDPCCSNHVSMEGHRPDLLLTDVNMPILDGLDLACRVKRICPSCPVLIVSAIGDSHQLAQRVIAANICVALEAKPVQICQLLSRIAELISQETQRSVG